MTGSPTLATLDALAAAWSRRWSPARPGAADGDGFGSGVLLEFERLPGMHRHAEHAVQYAEHVFRALHLLRALCRSTSSKRVFVSTFSWSTGAEPVARGVWLERFLPATVWHSAPVESWSVDPDDPDDRPLYEHTFVSELDVDDPALTAVLTLAVDDVQRIAVFPADASWVYTAEEEGAHVRMDAERASALVAEFPDWVGHATNERPVAVVDELEWQIQFHHLRHADAARVLDALETQGLLPAPASGRLVDPRDILRIDLGRTAAQQLRILRTGRPEVVVDQWEGERVRMTVGDVRRAFDEDDDPLFDLDEWIDEISYRHPADAEDGRLARRRWDPTLRYDGVDGS
ncbi:hypothetical protein [Curtobacterium sp. 9128]|uniref:hypothetical protein n=1 Tax=Curtobacterium sp. 9128 TaxID=1793722 RepID=UPI00164329B3|nr:hypothetical protein [Curtobacterium sp. 9128]